MAAADSNPAGGQAQSGAAAVDRAGLFAAFLAYGFWGFLPLLFHMLEGVEAALIVAHRTLWSLVLVGVIIVLGRRRAELAAALRDRRAVRTLVLSALLLAANWLLYVWAVETGQVLEASFGYFINPLVNVAIGMVFLGERQNLWQGVSIAIAAVGIAVQAIGVGGVPFIALGLAVSFGFYGFSRKTVQVESTTGLFIETLVLTPLALLYIGHSLATHGAGIHEDPRLVALLLATGPATALPLLLFAFAVRRLRLTTIGMLQYLAPSLQFLLAITYFGEALTPIRLVSFALIWISLAVFTADSLRRRARSAP